MISKKIFIALCGALLVVGLSFGEASAVRMDFSGNLSGNVTVPVTGYFEYTAPGSGVVQTPSGAQGAFATYSGITGSYGIAWDGISLTGTTLDARVYNDYASNRTSPIYDEFRISTDAPGEFTGVPRFQINFINKIGTAKQADLVGGLGLPESLNLFELRGFDPNTPSEEFTEVVARYWVSTTSSTAFVITNVTFTSAAAAVPEPATMLLLGSGLIGMGVFVRRKFKK